jgi:flagellar motor switch protein FliM
MPTEKILNQEEIEALLRAARNRPLSEEESQRRPRRVSAFTFGQAGRISLQQVGSISLLHDTFARNVSQRLGAHLRVLFEVNLVSVEQLSYSEFLPRVAERAYVASLNLQPLEATAVFQLDLALAFPIIDLLLGGEGKSQPLNRDLTEIEEQILESIVAIISQEMETVWEPLVSLKFLFDQRQQQAQVIRLFPSNEKVLTLNFEIRMPEVRGSLGFAFPAAVSGVLLRKISEQWLTKKRHLAQHYIEQRRQRLLDCRFTTEMKLPETPVRGSDLLALEVGKTLVLQHRTSDPVVISVADKKMFAAYPVRTAKARGGLIQRRLAGAVAVKELP